jgi:hypothetical protein
MGPSDGSLWDIQKAAPGIGLGGRVALAQCGPSHFSGLGICSLPVSLGWWIDVPSKGCSQPAESNPEEDQEEMISSVGGVQLRQLKESNQHDARNDAECRVRPQ